MNNTFLLYGANGYTARLITEQAASFGLVPILAGRSEAKLKPLAEQHGLTYRVADLSNAAALDTCLRNVSVVLHCAGPFSKTAKPMQQACLRTQTHYLDITGEVAVFEHGQRLDEAARERHIMLMSGVGFDVVPTDCIARYLHDQLPDAQLLQLAFANEGGSVSHGTAQTALEGMSLGGMARQNGRLVAVPNANKTLRIDFGAGRTQTCMSIPWGDLSTAWHTTRIPNIETYMAAPTVAIWAAKAGNLFGRLMRSQRVQAFLKKRIAANVTGPDEATRQRARTHVWGQATNAAGRSVTARLHGPEGYTLTALTALTIARHVLNGRWQAGYQTPAGLYGADLILDIDGVTREAL